jgi:predicted GNAT family acetyltransferase
MSEEALERAIAKAVIEDNRAASRFELRVGDELAYLRYRLDGQEIVLAHTEVPRELEGHGIAGRLAKHALEYARAKGLMVTSTCSYVDGYLERHPEYEDVVRS